MTQNGGALSCYNAAGPAAINVVGCAQACDPGAIQFHWYAVRTKPRHERKAEFDLLQRGISIYLPTVTETHYWSDRKKRVEVPVFPGYVFVRGDLDVGFRVSVLRANGVVGFVGSQNYGTEIPDDQIEAIRKLISAQKPFLPHPFLKVGQKIRIRGGALDGVTGILSECGRRLVVAVESISQGLSICVTGYDVQPA